MNNAVVFFKALVSLSKQGKECGICSVCSSNELVLETVLEYGSKEGKCILIESTANQVNQYGGYTGMMPGQFYEWIESLAHGVGFDCDRIILGGDHLGPLTWSSLNSAKAMDKAEELVRAYASAGFQKLHIDCSMRLGGDDPVAPMPVQLVAERTARLIKAAEDAATGNIVYVVGSEVPIPGGETCDSDAPVVTSASSLMEEYSAFYSAFLQHGLERVWERVVAMVVQPGVEFGDNRVFIYDPGQAATLVQAARELHGMVLEGHSTDYQPEEALKNMKRDGIAILKVGPALTFALRSALFALEEIERIVYPSEPEFGYSDFTRTLEQEMLSFPENWEKHYRGNPLSVALMRKYSLSDRSRYYLTTPSVKASMQRLLKNIDRAQVPDGLMYQYFPDMAKTIFTRSGTFGSREMVKNRIRHVLKNYG